MKECPYCIQYLCSFVTNLCTIMFRLRNWCPAVQVLTQVQEKRKGTKMISCKAPMCCSPQTAPIGPGWPLRPGQWHATYGGL